MQSFLIVLAMRRTWSRIVESHFRSPKPMLWFRNFDKSFPATEIEMPMLRKLVEAGKNTFPPGP
jgi:hypothetical protein